MCTEVKRRDTESIFAATPPLEATRILLAIAAQESPWNDPDPITVTVADVSRAHFYAKATRDVFVRLPEEDPRAQEQGLCGKLLRTWYGTLDAAKEWEKTTPEISNRVG